MENPVAVPSRPAQSLLAFLALTKGTAHRRERLAGLMWPDAEDDSAHASLRQGQWRVRKALEAHLPPGAQYLLADDLTVAFNPTAPAWLDVAVLEQPPNGAAPAERLKEAVGVYWGELLPGFYDGWVLRARTAGGGLRAQDERPDRLVAERPLFPTPVLKRWWLAQFGH